MADVQGVRAIMTLTADAGVGVRASDGKLLWRYRPVANGTANITTPVVQDNKVFYTSSYGTGGALLTLGARRRRADARRRSTSRATCRTITAASSSSTAISTGSTTRS